MVKYLRMHESHQHPPGAHVQNSPHHHQQRTSKKEQERLKLKI